MTTPSDPVILTRRSTADLSSSQYLLVSASGDDDLALTAIEGLSIGALTNDVADGSSTAVYVPVQVGGIIKVKCGGTITAGNLAGSNGSGQAVQKDGAHNGGKNSHAFGIALGTFASGDIGTFLWSPSWIEIS